MKKHRKSLFILAILTVIAIVFIFSQTQGTFKRGLKDFAISDTSNVVKIFLSDKANNNILLERKTSGQWMANDKYLVRKDMIDLLLSTMKNLSVIAPVPKAAFNTAVKNLASRSTKVEIYQRKYFINLFYRIQLFPRERLSMVYYVGDVTPDNIGTHMILENSEMPFIVYWPGFRGSVASRYSTRLTDWRDHKIFSQKYLQIESVEVFFPHNPGQSFRVVNNQKGFPDLIPYGQELPALEYDTLKMLGFITAFEDIRYEALIDDMKQNLKDSITGSQPFHIITLTALDGNKKQAKTFRRKAPEYSEDTGNQTEKYDPDRMYALINDDKDFVLIQYLTFNRIIKPLQFFLEKDEE